MKNFNDWKSLQQKKIKSWIANWKNLKNIVIAKKQKKIEIWRIICSEFFQNEQIMSVSILRYLNAE